MEGGGADTRSGLSRALSHPAALLLLTAALTGLLVPWVTDRWEERDRALEARRAEVERESERQRLAAERESERQRTARLREFELRAGLVARIGVASATFLSAIEVGAIRSGREDSVAEYRTMQRSALELASQVAAYFPASLPFNMWRDYRWGLRNAYHLLTAPAGRARTMFLDSLNRYFDRQPGHLDGLCDQAGNPSFDEAVRRLVLDFQKKQEAIFREILDSPTILTGTPTPDRDAEKNVYDSSLPACPRDA